MSTSTLVKHRGLIIRVAIPSPLRRLFDYLPPSGSEQTICPGVRVRVPFGNREVVGTVVECVNESTVESGRLKAISAVLDAEPLFTPALFRTLLWGASYYQHPIGEVIHSALPGRLRLGKSYKTEAIFWRTTHEHAEESIVALGRAEKQKALLELIENSGELADSEIATSGFSRSILNQLRNKQLIEKHRVAVADQSFFTAIAENNSQSPILNNDQQTAFQSIARRLDEFSCFLLDGVTGSGKTEVYMQVMQRQLARGRQCLVLVPEIGLTPQTVSRFAKRFACSFVVLHSGLNDADRVAAWNQARNGSAAIIIGTRSAIFTPLANPGLIVVDEEHDASFKQQDGFRYSARDLAVMRGKEEGVPVILGSATPSLESLYNCSTDKFDHLILSERAGNAVFTSMELVDISQGALDSGFSEQLLFKIEQHLDARNQVLVFINRRGFAPVLSCATCGWLAECDKCIAQLTVHTKPPGLRCHHCGTSRQLLSRCPICKSRELVTFGIGTQKVEEFLKSRFPSTPVLRIDRDSTRSRVRFEAMLEQINKGDSCLMLGTQMLAKGHHFPNITLVAVLDADAGLFSADFRGQEHMAQTIIQVAGRAGRAERAGEVYIQSRNAGHAVLQSLVRGSYAEFTRLLLPERKSAAMPPFQHLALLRAEAKELQPALAFLSRVDAHAGTLCAEQNLAIDRVGPVPAPMEKRAGRYRVQLLLKSPSRGMMQEFLSYLCVQMESMKQPVGLRWSIDVDPQDLI